MLHNANNMHGGLNTIRSKRTCEIIFVRWGTKTVRMQSRVSFIFKFISDLFMVRISSAGRKMRQKSNTIIYLVALNFGVALIWTSSSLFLVEIAVQTLHKQHKRLEMHRGLPMESLDDQRRATSKILK